MNTCVNVRSRSARETRHRETDNIIGLDSPQITSRTVVLDRNVTRFVKRFVNLLTQIFWVIFTHAFFIIYGPLALKIDHPVVQRDKTTRIRQIVVGVPLKVPLQNICPNGGVPVRLFVPNEDQTELIIACSRKYSRDGVHSVTAMDFFNYHFSANTCVLSYTLGNQT